MANLTKIEVKRQRAKKMYLTGKYQQKEIAETVGVAENTIGRWIKKYGWEVMRANMTTTKENVLSQLYAQIAEINSNIENRDEGQRYASAKEADSIVKISAAIRKMETETGIAEATSVCIKVCEFTRKNISVEKAQEINDIFNALIEEMMQ